MVGAEPAGGVGACVRAARRRRPRRPARAHRGGRGGVRRAASSRGRGADRVGEEPRLPCRGRRVRPGRGDRHRDARAAGPAVAQGRAAGPRARRRRVRGGGAEGPQPVPVPGEAARRGRRRGPVRRAPRPRLRGASCDASSGTRPSPRAATLPAWTACRRRRGGRCSCGPKSAPARRVAPTATRAFAERARVQADGAQVLVVNHALYLAHLAAGGGVLPHHDVVVFDEGHAVVDVATRALGPAR